MNTTPTLHRYLDAKLVLVQSDISSHKKLLQEIACLLAEPLQEEAEGNVKRRVYQKLLEREKLGNTCIGNGITLPHSRFAEAQTAIIALITLKQAIESDSSDRQPIDVAFGLIVPEQATQEHLNILADIARMMSTEGNKAKLASATSAEEAIALIESWS